VFVRFVPAAVHAGESVVEDGNACFGNRSPNQAYGPVRNGVVPQIANPVGAPEDDVRWARRQLALVEDLFQEALLTQPYDGTRGT